MLLQLRCRQSMLGVDGGRDAAGKRGHHHVQRTTDDIAVSPHPPQSRQTTAASGLRGLSGMQLRGGKGMHQCQRLGWGQRGEGVLSRCRLRLAQEASRKLIEDRRQETLTAALDPCRHRRIVFVAAA